MGSKIDNETLVQSIHHTTVLMVQSEMKENGFTEKHALGEIGFPMYFAFTNSGELGVLALPWGEIPVEEHQSILNDIRIQMNENGRGLLGFAAQNVVGAIERKDDHSEPTQKEIDSAKRKLCTQFCSVGGQSLAFVSNFDDSDYGWCTDNQSIKSGIVNHTLWASATAVNITWEQLNQAQAH